jgi:hypothetical protein
MIGSYFWKRSSGIVFVSKPVGMENTIRIHSCVVCAVRLREEAEERRKLCSLVYSFDSFVSFLSSNFSGMLHMLKS